MKHVQEWQISEIDKVAFPVRVDFIVNRIYLCRYLVLLRPTSKTLKSSHG